MELFLLGRSKTEKNYGKAVLLSFVFFSFSPGIAEDLTTREGQIEFLERVTQRYPGIPTQNLRYKRNFLELLSFIPELKQQLRDELGSTELPKQSTLLTQYYEGADAKPDPEKVGQLKELIKRSLAVRKTLGTLDSFKKDLTKLTTKKQIRQFLTAAPFLYDKISGTPLKNPTSTLQSATPAQIEQAYQVTLPQYLWPQVGKPTPVANEAYRNIGNSFHKDVARALTPLSPTGEPAIRKAVSIERVPASVALFRFFCGKDCSIQSVPFHALLRSTRVYFIYSSDRPNSDPSGYAFVVEAEHDGKKIPYVLTLNGHLSRKATRSTLSLIAQDLNSKQILLPDFVINPSVVNTDEMHDNLRFAKSKRVPISLSQESAWKKIDAFSEQPGRNRYENFYTIRKQKEAMLLESTELDLTPVHKQNIKEPYPLRDHSQKSTLLSRALLAAQILDTQPRADQSTLMRKFRVTEKQLAAVRPLYKVSWHSPLSAVQFKALQRELNFNLRDLDLMEVSARAVTIAHLYRNAFDLASEDRWKAIAETTLNSFRWVDPPSGEETKRELLKTQIELMAGIAPQKRLLSLMHKVFAVDIAQELISDGNKGLLIAFLNILKKQKTAFDTELLSSVPRDSPELAKLLTDSGILSERSLKASLVLSVEFQNLALFEHLSDLVLLNHETGHTLMSRIALYKTTDILKSFLKRHKDNPLMTLWTHELLEDAIKRGLKDIVKILHDNGTRIPSKRAFELAIEAESLPMFQLLLRLGLKANPTELFDAAIPEHSEKSTILQWLLDTAKPKQRQINRLLLLAAQRGNRLAIAVLLSQGANDLNGALRVALAQNNPTTPIALINRGADAHLEGDLAFRQAIASNDKTTAYVLFLRHPPLKKNYDKIMTALIEADSDGMTKDFVPHFKFTDKQLRKYQDLAEQHAAYEVYGDLVEIQTSQFPNSSQRPNARLLGLWQFCLKAFGG